MGHAMVSHDITSTTSVDREHLNKLASISLTLNNEFLCLSVDGFHTLSHCSHVSFSKSVLLNEVLDTCQMLPIVFRLQRDLGVECGRRAGDINEGT